jgi:cytosol alanyl aminopeptidase
LLWEFTKQNYTALAGRIPGSQTIDSGALLIRSQAMLCTPEARKEVEAFFADRVNSLGGGPRELAQTLERIDLCVARMGTQQKAMAEYLQKAD